MTIVARESNSVRTSSTRVASENTAANSEVGGSRVDSMHWKAEFKSAFRDVRQFCEFLELPSQIVEKATQATADFPLFVPRNFAEKITKRDPNDPILRQVLPSILENESAEGFSKDPVGDLNSQRNAGLIHKYHGRALLIANGVCAVHCRYCFRRHFPYDLAPSSLDHWESTLNTVREDTSIEEIILSGGDPLTMVDENLDRLISMIESIDHVERLRIHSRLPVVIPSRVTDALLSRLSQSRLSAWLVIHSNHANEICESVGESLRKLQSSSVTVLNQAVLLRGINDSVEAQVQLSKRLIQFGVIPYYLNHLDPVEGSAHFDTSIESGIEIVTEMRKQLPGFGVPRFVKEIPGEPHKTVLI